MKRTEVIGRLGLLTLLLLGGCALTSKAEANFPHYFSPLLPRAQPKQNTQRSGVELRLGRVSAGAHLREKMVYRTSGYEVGFYDNRLWTEKPTEYLRRALSQVLFEEEGLRSIISGSAPVLDVELVSFEELRAPQPAALVRVTFILRTERAVLLEQTLTVELPLAQATLPVSPDAIAATLGDALRSVVHQVTRRVLEQLTAAGSLPTGSATPLR